MDFRLYGELTFVFTKINLLKSVAKDSHLLLRRKQIPYFILTVINKKEVKEEAAFNFCQYSTYLSSKSFKRFLNLGIEKKKVNENWSWLKH